MEYSIVRIEPKVKEEFLHIGSKMKVNPYYGCSHACLFCPANDGFLEKNVFDAFREKKNLYVVDNIIQHIEKYISVYREPIVLHLSPVSDPFQSIEVTEGKTKEILEYCKEKVIPVAICTKGVIDDCYLELIGAHSDNFVQVSLLTLNEAKRKFLVRGDGATCEQLLAQIKKLVNCGIKTVVRVDPIFPYITDDMKEFVELVKTLKGIGAKYLVSSCADITGDALERELNYLESYEEGMATKYSQLYTKTIGNRKHAALDYRRDLFEKMSQICRQEEINFGITWEPDENNLSIAEDYSYGAENFFENLE